AEPTESASRASSGGLAWRGFSGGSRCWGVSPDDCAPEKCWENCVNTSAPRTAFSREICERATQDGHHQMLFLKRFFFSGFGRPKHAQPDPGHPGREPTAEVFNTVDVGAREAEPGFLNSVVRFPIGTENPAGDRP